MSYQQYTPPTQPATTAATSSSSPVSATATAPSNTTTTAAPTTATTTAATAPLTATTTTMPTATYPYSAYHHPSYATTPGGYTYATGYQTGVTGYGWTYPYTYLQQHNAQAAAAAAAAAASAQAHFARPTGVIPPPPMTGTQATGGSTASTTPAMTIPASTGAYATTTSGVATTSAATPHPSLPQRTATFSAYTPNYARDTYTGRGGKRQSNMRGLFTKELRNLMYGFGDDRNPSNDTVNVMEEILIEYITDVCQQAAGPTKKARLSIDDLRRALSNSADAKKLARLEELLFMQEDIKRARAQFDDNDGMA